MEDPFSFTLDGSMFNKIVSAGSEPLNMQLTFDGSPWLGVSLGETPATTGGNIKRILKVDWANVKTANKAIGH